jgi:dolichyl-phosphate-mannose--protein O-mannosyl transferase
MERLGEATPGSRARIAGVFYLLNIITGAVALAFVSRKPSLGVAANLVATACYVVVTILFYGLFKPVNRNLSFSRRSSVSRDAFSGPSAPFSSPPSP